MIEWQPSSKVWQMSYKYIRHFTMKKIQIIELYNIFKPILMMNELIRYFVSPA